MACYWCIVRASFSFHLADKISKLVMLNGIDLL